MKNDAEHTEAGRQFAAAYLAHYTNHDLPSALELYQNLMASNPSAQESMYARMQIQNIANAVVPKKALLDAQIELVRAHFKGTQSVDVGGSASLPGKAPPR